MAGRDVRHAGTGAELPPEVLLLPDPHLWNVWSDMSIWREAHPCDCEAGCECDGFIEDEERDVK
jgi:hypothetical protein